MPPRSQQKPSLFSRLKNQAEVAEGYFATLFGGLIVAMIHLGGLVALVWPFHESSHEFQIALRTAVLFYGILNLIAFVGNAITFKWMRFLMDEAPEPLPFQVIPYLGAESRWMGRAVMFACFFNVAVLSVALFFFELLFTQEVRGASGAVAMICFQLPLCFISNTFIVYVLWGFGFRESTRRKFWANRFTIDVAVSVILWASTQLIPDHAANVRT